ncbi:cytochrome c oxidase assembly protein [Melghirimyces algeriensis]|uniref:Putative membrane protein n=1 Tax=Melghirimyces algeriensis TaxID=910412 RepID=A0A521DW18_9BACL|nr:cytochrome c oxidase assembly protein [Melghirimyces algeriensis]SMO75792.1 putative membrane protein [Melghirimyces algeriensis]
MEKLIQAFFTSGLWNMKLNVLLLALGVCYLVVTRNREGVDSEESFVKPGTKAVFMAGLTIFYLALGSPLYEIGHELFSIHMLQQSLLYLIMPPLIIRGIPEWIWRKILVIQWIEKGTNWRRRPIITLVLFNGLFSLYHIPRIFDFLMGNELYHLFSHGVLTLAAFFMWWPVMTPLKEESVLTPLLKLAYIAAAGMLLTPACALIIFADHLLFLSFHETSTLFPVLSPIDDQQFGGVIMKILQEITYGIALGYVFFQWVRGEGQTSLEKEES